MIIFIHFILLVLIDRCQTISVLQIRNSINANGIFDNRTELIEKEFQAFQKKFNKKYDSDIELNSKMKNFIQNYNRIIEHRGKSSDSFGFTYMSDLNNVDFKQKRGLKLKPATESDLSSISNAESVHRKLRGVTDTLQIFAPLNQGLLIIGKIWDFTVNFVGSSQRVDVYWIPYNGKVPLRLYLYSSLSFGNTTRTINSAYIMFSNSNLGHGVIRFVCSTTGDYAEVSIILVDQTYPPSFASKNSPEPPKWDINVPFNWCSSWNSYNRSICSPIKDQGTCGACWALSATSAESVYSLTREASHVPIMAHEQVLSCAYSAFIGNPCDGGDDKLALVWIFKNGMQPKSDYSDVWDYEAFHRRPASPPSCNLSYSSNIDYAFPDHCKFTANTIDTVLINLQKYGPATISVDASAWDIHTGDSMISDPFICSPLVSKADHAINLVGWGKDEQTNKDYWIVRNSWGETWGRNGFAYILKDSQNVCGVLNSVYWIAPCVNPNLLIPEIFETTTAPSTFAPVIETSVIPTTESIFNLTTTRVLLDYVTTSSSVAPSTEFSDPIPSTVISDPTTTSTNIPTTTFVSVPSVGNLEYTSILSPTSSGIYYVGSLLSIRWNSTSPRINLCIFSVTSHVALLNISVFGFEYSLNLSTVVAGSYELIVNTMLTLEKRVFNVSSNLFSIKSPSYGELIDYSELSLFVEWKCAFRLYNVSVNLKGKNGMELISLVSGFSTSQYFDLPLNLHEDVYTVYIFGFNSDNVYFSAISDIFYLSKNIIETNESLNVANAVKSLLIEFALALNFNFYLSDKKNLNTLFISDLSYILKIPRTSMHVKEFSGSESSNRVILSVVLLPNLNYIKKWQEILLDHIQSILKHEFNVTNKLLSGIMASLVREINIKSVDLYSCDSNFVEIPCEISNRESEYSDGYIFSWLTLPLLVISCVLITFIMLFLSYQIYKFAKTRSILKDEKIEDIFRSITLVQSSQSSNEEFVDATTSMQPKLPNISLQDLVPPPVGLFLDIDSENTYSIDPMKTPKSTKYKIAPTMMTPSVVKKKLPFGWLVKYDENENEYYYNCQTTETTYYRPNN